MTRIVKPKGHVVFGDEALPPWLEGTEFGEIMITNNPLFKNKVPLECLPQNAREVTLRLGPRRLSSLSHRFQGW